LIEIKSSFFLHLAVKAIRQTADTITHTYDQSVIKPKWYRYSKTQNR